MIWLLRNVTLDLGQISFSSAHAVTDANTAQSSFKIHLPTMFKKKILKVLPNLKFFRNGIRILEIPMENISRALVTNDLENSCFNTMAGAKWRFTLYK